MAKKSSLNKKKASNKELKSESSNEEQNESINEEQEEEEEVEEEKEEKDKEKEFQKYKNIFTKERIDYYKAILKKVNDIFADTVNNGANINNILKDIFKEDLFDNLYYQIYDLFIVPFFQKFKETLRKEYDFDRKRRR